MPGNIGGALYLTDQSFEWRGDYAKFCIYPPSAVYYAKLNPSKGAHVKKYKISHRIDKGDIERFKVMVGAEMSTNLKLKFRFVMEEGKVIESEVFSIDIWHPRNTKTPYYYEDGEELLAAIEKKNSRHRLIEVMHNRTNRDTEERIFPLTLETDKV